MAVEGHKAQKINFNLCTFVNRTDRIPTVAEAVLKREDRICVLEVFTRTALSKLFPAWEPLSPHFHNADGDSSQGHLR